MVSGRRESLRAGEGERARVDRGAPALSQQELEQFCQRYGIRDGYISTSAMNGQSAGGRRQTHSRALGKAQFDFPRAGGQSRFARNGRLPARRFLR